VVAVPWKSGEVRLAPKATIAFRATRTEPTLRFLSCDLLVEGKVVYGMRAPDHCDMEGTIIDLATPVLSD
jgi:hypothetical protein